MKLDDLSQQDRDVFAAAVGYLNFSSGTSDPGFLIQLNECYRLLSSGSADEDRPWITVGELLLGSLAQLRANSKAFDDASQAEEVIRATHQQVLPAYQEFHKDLLFHQKEAFLFGPFFLGRVYEAVLQTQNENSTLGIANPNEESEGVSGSVSEEGLGRPRRFELGLPRTSPVSRFR